jgi:hypothetical protein
MQSIPLSYTGLPEEGSYVVDRPWIISDSPDKLVLKTGLGTLHIEQHPYVGSRISVGDAVTVSTEGTLELFSGMDYGHYCAGVVSRIISKDICEITCNGPVRNFGVDMRPGAKMFISDTEPGKLTDEELFGTGCGHLVGIALNSTDLMVITI